MIKFLRERDGTGTVYAKQVPPEYQESPLYTDWWETDEFSQECCIFGNNDYSGILSDDLEEIESGMLGGDFGYDPSWEVEDPSEETTLDDILNDYYPPKYKDEYSREEIEEWMEIAEEWSLTSDPELCARALTLMTGNVWESAILHGSVQGEWQNCIYDTTKITAEDLRRIETAYFNTGSEFQIEIDGEYEMNVYCYSWDEEGIKQEIADEVGCNPEDVVLELAY